MINVTFRRVLRCKGKEDAVFERPGVIPIIPPVRGSVIVDNVSLEVNDVVVKDKDMDILIVLQGLHILYKSTYNRALKEIIKYGWTQIKLDK